MILPGHLLICALDLVLGCALVNAQNLVIITFFCCHTCCSSQESLKDQESGTGFPVPDSSSLSLLQNGPNGAGNDPRPIGSIRIGFLLLVLVVIIHDLVVGVIILTVLRAAGLLAAHVGTGLGTA